MPFEKGKSGNPNGRPKGKENKATKEFRDLLKDNKDKLIQKALEMAEAGNPVVLNKLLDKIVPTLNENHDKVEAEINVNIKY